MKHILRMTAISAAALILLTACPDFDFGFKDTEDSEDTPVLFIGLEADGSETVTTTMLILSFDQDIEDLSEADIDLDEKNTGAEKGAFTRVETGVYELSLTGISASGRVTVVVVKEGYDITDRLKTVYVYYYTPPEDIPVSFTGLEADGSEMAATTTKLTLSFNKEIAGLSAADIDLDAGTTGAVTGALTKTGMTVYELSLTGIAASGTLTVSVAKPGYYISGGPKTAAVYYYTPSDFVRKVPFTDQTATVTFNSLNGNDIYLVKVNTSDSIVSELNTGGVFPPIIEEEFPRMGHPAADEFNANPPPTARAAPPRQRAAFVPPVFGDTRSFMAETYHGSGIFRVRQATLRASGQYGNIWVVNENFDSSTETRNKISDALAQEYAEKFDRIYLFETNLLGHEYGGDTDEHDGMDGDPKIQILIYDILNSSGTTGGTVGYFWGKDFYPDSELSGGLRSNLAEIFYINAAHAVQNKELICTALIHEFQHMIHFNQKTVKRGVSSSTWYNEMLSMMAEDLIAPLLGIPVTSTNHVIRTRMFDALRFYWVENIAEWGVWMSYESKCGFGAYLLRNYGGAELLQRILGNDTVNIASINSALNDFSSGLTFDQALTRYGEAMIYSGPQMPEGVLTYDKTVTSAINGTAYTAYGFNVWNDFPAVGGPRIFDLTPQQMRPHTISIHSIDEWKNITGNFSITLEKPANQNVIFYLMVK